ncbi:hypothetical protein [Elizabethkingia anophelis]|uniref:hypothetical protein n=1 Tax=Elizabethkingia anophelis TaxID=1117645 RepID=UPI00389280DE
MSEFKEAIKNYNQFLKQPLALWMFVPCDQNGNILSEPQMIEKRLGFDETEIDYNYAEVEVYKKAKERVLFEGFEIEKSKSSGKFYLIQNGIIQSESEKLRNIRNMIDIPLEDIFEDSELKTVKDFQTITKVPFIELGSKWEFYSCLNEPPKNSDKVSIWEKRDIGRTLKPSAYFDGIWKDYKTNEPIEHFTENHEWQVTKRRIYIDGQIFIQENI